MQLPYKHIIAIYSRCIQKNKYTLGNMQRFYVKADNALSNHSALIGTSNTTRIL